MTTRTTGAGLLGGLCVVLTAVAGPGQSGRAADTSLATPASAQATAPAPWSIPNATSPTTTPATAPWTRPDAPVFRNVRWQALDRRITDVYVAPNGRLWYCCQPPAHPPVAGAPIQIDIRAEARREVEAQWKPPARQGDAAAGPPVMLAYCRPALFEPSGRVWVTAGKYILGYDGSNWAEMELAQTYYPPAGCPGHASPYWMRNCWAGAAFFPVVAGVACYDDGQERPLKPAVDQRSGYAMMVVQPLPDGKGALAWAPSCSQAWLYRKGAWDKLPLPKSLGDPQPGTGTPNGPPPQPQLAGLAVVGERLWLAVSQRGLVTMDLAFSDADARAAAGLIAQLGDDRYKVREKATADLIAMGPPAWPAIREAQAKATDLEVKHRLDTVLDAPGGAALKPLEKIGVYRVDQVQFMRQTQEGLILIMANSVKRDDKELQAGLVMVQPSGRVHYAAYDGGNPSPLVADGGKTVYLQGPTGGRNLPARRVDLSGESIKEMDVNTCGLPIMSATADGTLFCGQPGYSSPILVRRPNAPDERPVARCEAVDVSSQNICVSRDDCLWAMLPGKGLSRFDGRQWTPVVSEDALLDAMGVKSGPSAPSALMSIMLSPVSDGVLGTFSGRNGFILTSGTSFASGKMVTALIDADRALAARALGGPRGGANGSYMPVVADGRGNIWVCDTTKCYVLPKGADKWLDVDLGEKPKGGYLQLAGPLAVGESTVLLRGYDSRGAGAKCLYATLTDGNCQAAAGTPLDTSWLAVLDNEGVIWAAKVLYEPGAGPSPATLLMSGTTCRRVFEGYRPMMADKSGGVWLWPFVVPQTEERAARTMLLARSDGTIAARAVLPDAGSRLLGCDPGGGVWASSPLGPVRMTPPLDKARGERPDGDGGDRPGVKEYESTKPYCLRVGEEEILPNCYGPTAATSRHLVFVSGRYDASAYRMRLILMPIPQKDKGQGISDNE